MDASVDAPSATIRAMAEEEEEVEDDGKTVALARGGATDLARIAGRISLTRAPRGTSFVRIVLKATLAFVHYRHHPEGMTTTIRTRGLGASRSRAPSLASWVVLRPRLPSAPLSSSLTR